MTIKNIVKTSTAFISYNMKVIFGGKFFWFLIIALLLFVFMLFNDAYRGNLATEENVYQYLLFPALLLIFYPSVFGIQNDADNKILEILFGIPNYMYKIWFARLIMIYIETYIVLVLYAYLANYLFCPVDPFEMAYHILFPTLFIGNLAFLYSTLTRNGNATAVLIIVSVVAILILSKFLGSNQIWDVFFNPLDMPEKSHPAIFERTTFYNKLFLGVGSVVLMMLGLLNLQKREKFV